MKSKQNLLKMFENKAESLKISSYAEKRDDPNAVTATLMFLSVTM